MSATVSMTHGLAIAAILFALGLVGLLVRRNLLYMLMCVEIMLNAAGLAFVVAAAKWGQADGQVMFLIILSVAAAEVAVGLALAIRFYNRFKTLDADVANDLRG
jgi:NADH-quinone oxidoreductase subunit K